MFISFTKPFSLTYHRPACFYTTRSLRLEVDVQSCHICINHLILRAREKAFCSTYDHPKHVAPAADIPQHLQDCSNFCWKAEELSTLLPPELQHRQNIIHFPSPPWQHSTPHEEQITTTVPGIAGHADNTDLKCWCRLTTIAYQADYTIYTDRSTSRGTRNRGAAGVVTRGSPLQTEVVTTIKTKRRTFTSSYEGEAAAMESALS